MGKASSPTSCEVAPLERERRAHGNLCECIVCVGARNYAALPLSTRRLLALHVSERANAAVDKLLGRVSSPAAAGCGR